MCVCRYSFCVVFLVFLAKLGYFELSYCNDIFKNMEKKAFLGLRHSLLFP